jgi:hypothetical protein
VVRCEAFGERGGQRRPAGDVEPEAGVVHAVLDAIGVQGAPESGHRCCRGGPLLAARCSACRNRSVVIRSAPLIQAAQGHPQAFAWKIGTIGTRPESLNANALPLEMPSVCR